ncbi:phosphohistidine phosphatase SixA [Lonepinella sp. MS14437]|uniref:phosphohistidine phosphatase SixA n=1 Tax=unclassified Lonepinella TaxID=2642006 RepID=UPI0036DF5739
MKIFIMRHGEAEMFAKSDKDRPLTEFGEQSSSNQGAWLKETAAQFDKVLVSPYIRTKQTFEYINNIFDDKLTERTEIWDAITPYGKAEVIVDYLSVLFDEDIQQILIVSHLPLVGEIVAELCGKNNVSFLPATIAEIDWDGEIGKLIQTKNPQSG